MNYITQKRCCKVGISALLAIIFVISTVVCAYAYERNNIYTLTDVSLDSTFLATLKKEDVYILDVSPRNTAYSPYVLIDYDDLSDLVFRCNQQGVNATLSYNKAVGMYLGYVNDSTVLGRSVNGCLGNSKGSIYLAESKTEITTPDTGTTTPTTPTITFDDTNIVNAVEGVFDQLTWVIRCQFEQMQDTLVNGRILLNINNLISKNIIPYLEDILVANTAASGTLQAFYHSFESKFSDLDTVFGTDTSMEVHNGDLLTWDSTSRGFTSATADGTADTVRLTPTTTLSGYNVGWTSDGNFSITPVGGGYFPDTLDVGTGTVTMPVIKTTETEIIANPELNQYVPEGYTQYEDYYGEIDLGVVPQRGMTLDTGLDLTSTTSLSRLARRWRWAQQAALCMTCCAPPGSLTAATGC